MLGGVVVYPLIIIIIIIIIIVIEEKDTNIKGTLSSITIPFITLKKKCFSVSSIEGKNFMKTPKQQLSYVKPRKETAQMLVFSDTPFQIDQNKTQNHSIDKVQNLGNEIPNSLF